MKFERQLEYDKTYLKMAKVLSQLSYANRNKVGALIVSEKGQIIAQGWNGTPSGMDNCCEEVRCDCTWIHGCRKNGQPIENVLSVEHCKDCNHASLTTKQEVLHAESNAISKCAKWLSSTENATLYVTLSPCTECAKLIIQAGIKRVVYCELYRDTRGIDLLVKNNIDCDYINNI
jgi:dCMP deaminase